MNGRTTPIREGNGFMLLPPPKEACQTCAQRHPEDQPHNAQTMFYQVKFRLDHGRDPSWIDAWAHCAPEVQAAWRGHLISMGVDVDAGKINPTKGARS